MLDLQMKELQFMLPILITWVSWGKPLFLFHSCCFVLNQKISLVLWDWVGFFPLLEFPFNSWEDTKWFHGIGCS